MRFELTKWGCLAPLRPTTFRLFLLVNQFSNSALLNMPPFANQMISEGETELSGFSAAIAMAGTGRIFPRL